MKHKPRLLSPWAEHVIAAIAVSVIVWGFLVIGPLVFEGLAR